MSLTPLNYPCCWCLLDVSNTSAFNSPIRKFQKATSENPSAAYKHHLHNSLDISPYDWLIHQCPEFERNSLHKSLCMQVEMIFKFTENKQTKKIICGGKNRRVNAFRIICFHIMSQLITTDFC